MSRAKLSYKKFSKLLTQNGYSISLIYYKANDDTRNVIFFETKLPKSQKNVIVYISPTKYVMSLPKEVQYKTIEIVSVEDERVKSAAFILTERSLHYLIGVRGPLIESDMAVVSSNGVCYTKFNGENYCYFMASKVKKIEEDIEEGITSEDGESADEDEIALLEASVKKVAKKEGVQLEAKIEKEKEVFKEKEDLKTEERVDSVNKEISEEPKVEIESEAKTVEAEIEPVELEFVEDSSTEVVVEDESNEEECSLASSSSESEDSKETNPVASKSVVLSKHSGKQPSEEGIKLSHRTNYVVPEELDVYYGIVYVSIDINTLYKSIVDYESEALSIYEQVEDNEKDMRITRLNTTKKNLEIAAKYVDTRVKNIELEERGLKYQLLRLTGILHNIDTLKKNKKIDGKGIENVVNSNLSELNKIYDKTRKTVHEVNLQLLKKREEYEEILANYEYSIAELLEL